MKLYRGEKGLMRVEAKGERGRVPTGIEFHLFSALCETWHRFSQVRGTWREPDTAPRTT